MNQNRFWSWLAAVLHFCLDMWLEIAAGEILFAWPLGHAMNSATCILLNQQVLIPTIRSRVIVLDQQNDVTNPNICYTSYSDVVLRARPPCPCVSKAQDVPLGYHRSNWKPWPITTLALWPCRIKVLQQTFL
jgi:hypothetical protein